MKFITSILLLPTLVVDTTSIPKLRLHGRSADDTNPITDAVVDKTPVSSDTYDAESELEDDTPNPDIFEPAADLDTFRNVDPTKFEWVNPDEIEAGGTTCGFLKAPFGWPAGSSTGFKESDSQTDFPIAQVCKSFQSDIELFTVCILTRYMFLGRCMC